MERSPPPCRFEPWNSRRSLMIRDHLVGEAPGLLVPPISRELARLDLEHVADGCFFHEIGSCGANTQSRIHSRLFPTDCASTGAETNGDVAITASFFMSGSP